MGFNAFAPTTQMLGRWQPWHDGHTELFKRALAETGQVCIQIRTVPQDTDASGGRTMTQDDNPFIVEDVKENIKKELEKHIKERLRMLILFPLLHVQTTKELSTETTSRLTWLFGNQPKIEQASLDAIFIGPRAAMITPWSTNAV